jgi:hypothetical protein
MGGALAVLTAGMAHAAESPAPAPLSTASSLDLMRARGDIRLQRRHVWNLLVHITRPGADGRPLFESWYGEDEAFSTGDRDAMPRGIRGFARTAADNAPSQTADAPVLTYTLYNDAAYRHIRDNRLYLAATLDRLRIAGSADRTVVSDRAVPAFPTDAVVLKTAWWPVARTGVTAMPVWDPAQNPPRDGGNGYASWQRVVAIDPSAVTAAPDGAVDFAGRTFTDVHHVGLDAFHYVRVDGPMAERIMRDRDSRKAILIALGRPLAAGDYLVLAGASLATREVPDWIWATFWWHDHPDDGPFAAGRPRQLTAAWRDYLLRVAFDETTPKAADGGPHVCFNPWLEARFPDGGHGGGTESNCMACHRRASYPPVNFLPVTRGTADLAHDRAYAPGQLRTSFLWAIAMHAKPVDDAPHP